jgi:alpha-galactosidase
MPKVTMLGAGSAFTPRLATDIMLIDGLNEGQLALVDVDAERLEIIHKLIQKIIADAGSKWTVTATTNRTEVMADSDYLINTIEVSGVQTVRFDNDIPAKYGVDQCIGDTIGPGGIFKGLRTIPVWLDVLADAERLCPACTVLNYTNPMSMMTLAATRSTGLPVVGLCHSVQGTSRKLANYMDVPYDEMVWDCGGINHMAWFTRLARDGEDLYPLLHKKAEDPQVHEQDPVRFDIMKHFGYFVTESSGHFSEYVPYYRKRPELIRKFCGERYLGGSSFYADNWPQWRADADARRRRQLAGEEPFEIHRSHEYASSIIEAMELDRATVIYGSVANRGLIENLPADGVVEVAVLVDKAGLHPCRFGPLPAQVAALCAANMRCFELGVQAALHRDRRAAFHALLLDPLTAAVCSPEQVRQMCDELFEAEAEFLPGY